MNEHADTSEDLSALICLQDLTTRRIGLNDLDPFWIRRIKRYLSAREANPNVIVRKTKI